MIVRALAMLLLLMGGCVHAVGGNGAASGPFTPAAREAAAQRVRFAAEAVCLNNRTRDAQDRAARQAGFTARERQPDGSVVYSNLGVLTFLRLERVPAQTFSQPDGSPGQVSAGPGCLVGSPAVDTRTANRLVGEILAPRLIEGDQRVSAPVGSGENDSRGVGFFFEDLSVTVPLDGVTTVVDGASGRERTFVHSMILVVHDR